LLVVGFAGQAADMSRRQGRPGPPDTRLNPYRRGVAVVSEGERPIGYLATRVQWWWTRQGRWPFHRYVEPIERPEWLLTFIPPRHGPPYDDGVIQDVAAEIDHWKSGRFPYEGQALTLRWLNGPDADDAWAAHGWGDDID
jgi:hypothetical protein